MLVKPSAAIVVDLTDTSCAEILNITAGDTICFQNDCSVTDPGDKKDDTVKENKKKRIISAISAFPFPFGFMGAHRVMLGTKPWVPIVYVATFGGCFGLLPLIDFFVITFSKDIEQYENNPRIFMWIK